MTTPLPPKDPSEDFDFVAEITTELVVGRRIRLDIGEESSDKSSLDRRPSSQKTVPGTIMQIVQRKSRQPTYKIVVDVGEDTEYNESSYLAENLEPIPFGFKFHQKELVHPWMPFYRDALARHFSGGQSDSQWEKKIPEPRHRQSCARPCQV